MKEFLDRITAQQKAMGYHNFTEEQKWEYFRSIALALNVELTEVLEEVPWKPWKPINKQKHFPTNAAMEICDVFVFTFVLWITLNPQLDLETAMRKTMDKIEKRIQTINYGKQEKRNDFSGCKN